MPTPSKQWEIYQCAVTGRYFDPFRVLASLHHYAAGKLNELVKESEKDPAAAIRLAGVGRRAFALPPVSDVTGEGTPDAVILGMVEAFAEYVKGKAGGAGSWRSWLRPSVPPQQPSAPKTCLPCGSPDDGLWRSGPGSPLTSSR